MVKIFSDPGHVGDDSGASGNGLKEKDLTLDISKRVKKYLDDHYTGHRIKMSRTSDATVSLSERTNEANNWGADFFLSIHINSGGGTGYEDYIYNQLDDSSETAKLRDTIHSEIVKQLDDVMNRGKKKGNLHVLRESKMSAMLSENMFIDTKSDADKLKSSSFLNKIAKGHMIGLAKALDLKEKSQSDGGLKETYIVKKGDSLSQIARDHHTTVDTLMEINNISDPDFIKPGQELKVTEPSSHDKSLKVGQTVTLKKSADKFTTGESIADYAKGKTYEILQVKLDRVLLDEIMSWVKKSDIQ